MDNDMNKPCVLVVDDVAENIDVLAGALVHDYEVKIALNGEDAMDIALSKPHPDLVLLDIMMPGMDGYEVCQRLQENKNTRDIPVIFVTAMGEMEDEAKGFDVVVENTLFPDLAFQLRGVRIGTDNDVKIPFHSFYN